MDIEEKNEQIIDINKEKINDANRPNQTTEAIIDEAIKYANEINAPWHSSIAKYIFSERFDVACKGNYSAIYAWR